MINVSKLQLISQQGATKEALKTGVLSPSSSEHVC